MTSKLATSAVVKSSVTDSSLWATDERLTVGDMKKFTIATYTKLGKQWSIDYDDGLLHHVISNYIADLRSVNQGRDEYAPDDHISYEDYCNDSFLVYSGKFSPSTWQEIPANNSNSEPDTCIVSDVCDEPPSYEGEPPKLVEDSLTSYPSEIPNPDFQEVLNIEKAGLRDNPYDSFNQAWGDDISGFYLSEPKDPTACISEFLSYSRKIFLRLRDVPDYQKLIHRVGGVFITGSAERLRNEFRVFVSLSDSTVTFTRQFDERRDLDLYVTEECRVLPEFELSEFRRVQASPTLLHMTQGPGGCGKTRRIVDMVKAAGRESMVLTSTRAMCLDISEQLKGFCPVHTIDSYLMHKRSSCQRLFIDEVTLSHPGKYLLAVAISRCSFAHGFGDAMQIDFIDRHNIMTLNHADFRSFFPITDYLRYSYRMPKEICHAIAPYYKACSLPEPISVSPERNTFLKVKPLSKFSIPAKQKVLVFCQADKFLDLGPNVSTVHEFQGKQADIIHLYCSQNSYGLQNSVRHVIVALSRHFKRLYIYNDYENTKLMQAVSRANSFEGLIVGGAILHEPELIGWTHPVPFEYVGVSRTSSLTIPAGWKNCRTLMIKKGRTRDPPVRLGQHAVFNVPEEFKISYRDLIGYFSRRSKIIVGRRILLSDEAFPNVQSHLVVRVLNTYSPHSVKVHSANTRVVPNEVFKFSVANGLETGFEPIPIYTDSYDVNFADTGPDVPSVDNKLGVIQDFVTAYFTPEVAMSSNEFLEFDVHHSDNVFPLDEISYNTSKGVYHDDTFAKLRPNLLTPVPRPQKDTNINAFHSILKRNANVPRLATVDDKVNVAVSLVDNLIGLCPGIVTTKLDPTPESVSEWCSEQPLTVLKQLTDELSVNDTAVNFYTFALKKSPKPDLTPEAAKSYPAVQTILCQEKIYNAIFCPIFRNLRDRIMSCLDKRIMFFTKYDDDTFSKILTHRFPPDKASKFNVAEFDMSKYDKSQGLLVLLFECFLLERLGTNPLYCRMWFLAHAFCKAKNMNTGLTFRTWYQRKSGDASTYLGNTLILLMSILSVVPIEDIGFLLCSGDDSLLWTRRNIRSLKYDILATRFNFEVKLFEYKYHYFCSKFLLPHDGRWFLVPDPLKRAVKLGRHDLVNFEHLEEYRISFQDNVQIYKNYFVSELASFALMERYSCQHDPLEAIFAMYQISTPDEFAKLFYTLPGDVLCQDPTRPSIEI